MAAMDLPFGPITSLIGLVRDHLTDRPAVKVIGRLVDHGEPPPELITWHHGKIVHLQVHSTGRQPVHVSGLGFELADGSHHLIETGHSLPRAVERPGYIEREQYLASLKRDLQGKRVRGFVVLAMPDRIYHQRLPKAWRNFPNIE